MEFQLLTIIVSIILCILIAIILIYTINLFKTMTLYIINTFILIVCLCYAYEKLNYYYKHNSNNIIHIEYIQNITKILRDSFNRFLDVE